MPTTSAMPGIEPDLDRTENRHAEPMLLASLRVLRRRARLALFVFVAFTVPAGAFVRHRPPVYEATARILVERNDEVATVRKEARTDESLPSADLQMQAQMLRSRPVVAKAIWKIRLWESSQFAVGGTPASVDEISKTGLVDRFNAQLAIVPVAGTHLLTVSFAASDRTWAMKAVNALTETYISDQIDSQFADASKTVGWLSDRVDEQRKRLDASETALQTYMETNDAVAVQDRQNIVVQKLADLNTALTRAKTDRMSKQALFQQLDRLKGDPGAIDALPIVLSNPVLQQLRSTIAELKQKDAAMSQDLGPRHPEMVKIASDIEASTVRLRAELEKVSESVKNDYIAAGAIERSLVQALDEQKRDVLDLNRKTIEYGSLQRQAVSDREIYERLLTEAQTRGVIRKAPEMNVRVLEPAELPLAPTGPQNSRDLLLVIAAGLFLAVGAALAVESFDQRIKTPADVELRLQIPCISMVPRVADGSQLLMTGAPSLYHEAFRRLRTVLSNSERNPSHVLVTSALPEEGKSLVAANLAVALARAKQRVVLVDGDLRRPSLHKLFALEPAPGLADLLNGHSDVPAAVRAVGIPNLWVVPCGRDHGAAAEALSAPALKKLLTVLESKFDWIVFDSPPVGPVADACLFGRLLERALVVVAADSTPVGAAAATIQELKSANVELVGVILNRVDLRVLPAYYSPMYYGAYSGYRSEAAGSVH